MDKDKATHIELHKLMFICDIIKYLKYKDSIQLTKLYQGLDFEIYCLKSHDF